MKLKILKMSEMGSFPLGENPADVEKEQDVEQDGRSEEGEGEDGKNVDLVSDGLEIFKQFLLFEGIAISGFADHLELIFNALEGGVLLAHLEAEVAMLGAEVSEAFLNGLEVNSDVGRLGWVGRLVEDVGDGGADVAVEEGQDFLNEGDGHAEGAHGAVKAVALGRGGGVGEGAARGRGRVESIFIGGRGRIATAFPDRQGRSDRAGAGFIRGIRPAGRFIQAETLCVVHGLPSSHNDIGNCRQRRQNKHPEIETPGSGQDSCCGTE